MQIQETIEYAVTLLQTALDTTKSLSHADNVAHPKPESSDERALQSKKNQTKSERG